MARKQNSLQPLTTTQRLSSIVKSCRDIMRKDKGLNGDLGWLPMLTWIMFLKFLDDMEQIAEQEAQMAGKRFRPRSNHRIAGATGRLSLRGLRETN
jgi:type I restriction enzyme M protein